MINQTEIQAKATTRNLEHRVVWCFCEKCQTFQRDPIIWHIGELTQLECLMCGNILDKALVLFEGEDPPDWWIKNIKVKK